MFGWRYFAATLIVFGRADSVLGRRRVSTPSVILASAFSASTGAGRRRLRLKEPCGSSRIRYSFSSCLNSPSMVTTSSRIWMLKSLALVQARAR